MAVRMARKQASVLLALTFFALCVSAHAEQAVRMARFFKSVQPGLISVYSRVARQPSPAHDAGLLSGGATVDAVDAAFDNLRGNDAGEADMKILSSALDFFHQRLNSEYGGETSPEDLDLDFVAEGRRLLAIQSFQVLANADEAMAAACCLGEISRLVEGGCSDAGALVLLPGFESDVALFTDMFLREPLAWLGLDNVVVDAMRPSGGAPVPLVRLFTGLSEVPKPVEVSVTRLSARQIVEALDLENP
ncbi:hypothetical protein KFE25_007821 [Diacronema lutheri]|uniref:Uncharacterized protein n=1 Tax=Diacronema lutheri TaxID=2081491 RepID=A0A8J5XPT9_DIALT|nr:hypothetical protein KFE25_007821 [Diacronema lutheri]